MEKYSTDNMTEKGGQSKGEIMIIWLKKGEESRGEILIIRLRKEENLEEKY